MQWQKRFHCDLARVFGWFALAGVTAVFGVEPEQWHPSDVLRAHICQAGGCQPILGDLMARVFEHPDSCPPSGMLEVATFAALVDDTDLAQQLGATRLWTGGSHHEPTRIHTTCANPWLGKILLQIFPAGMPTLQFHDGLPLVILQVKSSFASNLIVVGRLQAVSLDQLGSKYSCHSLGQAWILASRRTQACRGLGAAWINQLSTTAHQQQRPTSGSISQLPHEMAAAAMPNN